MFKLLAVVLVRLCVKLTHEIKTTARELKVFNREFHEAFQKIDSNLIFLFREK